MTSTLRFDVKPIVVEVSLNGETFHFERLKDTVTVEALQDGDAIEQLRSSHTVDGGKVAIRDENGTTAVYSTRADGDVVHITIEVNGETHTVEVTVGGNPGELFENLGDVRLPQLHRILRFAEQIKTSAELRAALPGFNSKGDAFPGGNTPLQSSHDCELACLMAVEPGSPLVQIFASGYCASCIVHGH